MPDGNWQYGAAMNDQNINKDSTVDPGAPVVFSPTIPDPTTAPATTAKPEPDDTDA